MCLICELSLPRTRFNSMTENEAHDVFKGRLENISCLAFLYFKKGGIVRNLIHAVKYDSGQDLAKYLGSLYAMEVAWALPPEGGILTAVPLHRKKQKLRGYNQSSLIGLGFSEVSGILFVENILERSFHSGTQTKKKRYERWSGISDSFVLIKEEAVRGKHVILLDDVLTTGATLEACSREILKGNPASLRLFPLCLSIR